MTRKMTWIPVILMVFGSGLAVAQKPGINDRNEELFKRARFRESQQKQTQVAMYEDIEILRRLLSSKLEKLYPQSSWKNWNQPFMQYSNRISVALADARAGKTWLNVPLDTIMNQENKAIAEPLYRDLEGCYLPGCGIIYTVTLPPLQRKPRPKSTEPQPKPLSDWERIQKQLHGEELPDKGQQPPVQAEEPSLFDVIVKTLFENGRHLTRLNDNERLTVAITFRSEAHQNVQVTAAGSAANSAATGTSSPAIGNGAGTSTTLGFDNSFGSTAKPLSSGQEYLLLGDLHMRQGQANNAIKAYQRALNDFSAKIGDPDAPDRVRELHQKLAQAYLSKGDVENARKEFVVLEKIQKLQARQPGNSDTSAKPAETRLPAKLLISAPKRLLEQAGTISFELFKKGVTVEELDFSPLKDASPSSGSR